MNIKQYENTIVLTDFTDEESTKIYRLVQGKTEKILPRPVIRDGKGKLIKNHAPRDFYLKLQEEIFEVMEVALNIECDWNATDFDDLAEEIADVITVCISYLNALGYDENARSEIFRKVNDKNEKRGYFKECD